MAESSLRETIEASFKEVEDEAEGEGSAATAGAAPGESTPEVPEEEGPGSGGEGDGGGDKPAVPEPEKGPGEAKPGEVKEPPKEDEQPRQAANRRAPGTWRPAVREQWSKLPAEVQSEILRREAEIARGMSESTNARKFQEEFQRVTSQYQNMINAEGGNPMRFVNDLFVTASMMYHGSPAQKANAIAGFIYNFGVDLEMLDKILQSGKPMQTPTNGGGGGNGNISAVIQQEVQRHLAPFLRGQQQSEEAAQQQVSTSIEAFAADPKNEFFDDVRETMADLLEVAARRNQQMDLSTAYNRATMMHPEIAKVIEDRNLRKRAEEASATARAARKKSVSVTGAPAKAAGESKPDTLRGDIEAAIAQAEGG